MPYDEVLRELHAVKDALSAKYGNDVGRIVKALQRKQKQHPEKMVSFAAPSAKPARARGRGLKQHKGRAA